MALPDSTADALAVRLTLRRTLRMRRALLSDAERSAAVRRILHHLSHSVWLRAGLSVGMYVSFGNEFPTEGLVALAYRRRCQVYFPRIVDYRRRRMVFAPDADGRWRRNRYGIPEPLASRSVPARALHVAFVPVLGFDAIGTRLGVGGGYYDRAFAHRQLWPSRRRPLLVGIAFTCQQLPHIDRYAHDVALDAVVTEDGATCFKARVTSEGRQA